MPYKLDKLAPNLVKLTFIGDFDDDDAVKHVVDMDPILDAAWGAGMSVDILADAHQLGKISARARRVFAERNGDPRIGRTAILGINRFLQVLIHFIVTASGRDNLQAFHSEAEALAWLHEENGETAEA